MPTSAASGSQTAVISTEHTLGSALTTGGSYVLVVDTNAMVNGDKVELRIYTKAKTGSTERLAWVRRYAHAQAELNKYSVPVPADVSFKATLKQTDGTGRTFDWSILQL